MRTAGIALSIVLAGCVTANETYTPTGAKGHVISCSGTANSWGACQQKAGELCGSKGYNVLSQSGEQGAIASGTQGSFFGSTTHSRSMMIECKQ